MVRNILVVAGVVVLTVTSLAFAGKMGMGGGCCGSGAHHTCALHHAQ